MITNQSVRTKWERKKASLRIKAALFFVIYNVIGIQLIAPGESISKTLSEFMVRSTFLNDIALNLPKILTKYGIPNIDSYKIFGFTSKWSVIILLAYLIYYFFNNKDPLSNIELLRDIHNKELKFYKFYLNEIKFYAKYLPSNRIADHCDKCANNDCYNRITHDGDKKNRIWCKLFAMLSPNYVEFWHKSTHECRRAYYYKYGFLFTSILLASVIMCAFTVEKIIKPNDFSISYIFTCSLVFLSFFLYLFFDIVHMKKKGSGGAWRKFAEKSDRFFNSDDFDIFFKENVCYMVTNQKEVSVIVYLNKYINYMLEDKILRHVSRPRNRSNANKENINRILQFIKAFYSRLNNNKILFRVSLFIVSDDGKYLKPYICDKTNLTQFACVSDRICPEHIKEFFSINGDSIAAKAFRRETIVCTNNTQKVIPDRNSPLESIMCCPLILNDSMITELDFHGKIYRRKHSVLCIDCNELNYFTEINQRINQLIIEPFLARINYEKIIAIFYSDEGE